MHLRLISLCLLLFFTACGANSQHGATEITRKATQPKSSLQPGKVHAGVKVFADTTQRYAVYLPPNYSHKTPLGLVCFFDSQGNGELPVRKYSVIADMYEVVLVGSMNSRNGQTPIESDRIYRLLEQDVREKFSIDSNRIQLAGFSGGARVAASLAQLHPHIKAVAGCAAGFQPQAGDKFSYFGIVGVEDFNYQEMRALDEVLDQTPVHHMFEYFVGGHEWPTFGFMAKAFQFFQMRSMAAGHMPKADQAIDGMMRNYRIQDSTMLARGEEQYRWVLQRKTIGYMTGLRDITDIQALKSTLDSSKGVKAERARLDAEFQQEMALRQQYVSMLQTTPYPQWERMAPMLRKMARHGADELAWMYMRVVNFLSLNAFMLSNQALNSGDLAAAERFIGIYGLVDPPNSEHALLRAKLMMRRGDSVSAFAALEQAFSLGNREWQRISTDPDFSSIRAQAAFLDLVKRMQTIPAQDRD